MLCYVMQAGARGEAPRVAQEPGIANVYVMQAGERGEAPRVVGLVGVEPTTFGSANQCSILLNYRPCVLCRGLSASASITQGVMILTVHRSILSWMPTVEPICLVRTSHDIFTACLAFR